MAKKITRRTPDPAGTTWLSSIGSSRLPEYWQPVGGGVEPGDRSIRDAVARERREELKLELAHEALRFEISTPYDFGQGRVHQRHWFELPAALELPAFPATQRFLRHLNDRLER
jgi:8-oxo-dGTP pyrophosphatase MutT (NUDIX family)